MNPPRPKRRLGQHFLFDPSILGRIAAATGAGPGDTVLEIGPGPGGLTAQLLQRGCRVVAVERDPDLLEQLRGRADQAEVHLGDALAADWYRLSGMPDPARWIIAGNIPYNLTSPLIDRALGDPLPARVVFLLQDEVAARLSASPGAAAYGALTVGVQAVAEVERLFKVPAGAFTPAPKVDSAVVRLTPLVPPLVPPAARGRFRTFVQGLFGRRRKQLLGSLRQVTGQAQDAIVAALDAVGALPSQRAETLSPQQLWRLAQQLFDGGKGAC